MSAVVSMSASMPPTWSLVKEIRKNSSEYLQKGSNNSVDYDAVIMVVSELVENAVKYGVRSSNGTCVDFNLSVHDSLVEITVKNGLEKLEDYESIVFALDAINGPKSREDLYRARLVQIYDSPVNEKGCLGLYRIAYEGGFNIACQLESDLVKLRAWRDFNNEA